MARGADETPRVQRQAAPAARQAPRCHRPLAFAAPSAASTQFRMPQPNGPAVSVDDSKMRARAQRCPHPDRRALP